MDSIIELISTIPESFIRGLPILYEKTIETIKTISEYDLDRMACLILILSVSNIIFALLYFCKSNHHNVDFAQPKLKELLKPEVNESTDYFLIKGSIIIVCIAVFILSVIVGQKGS